MIHVKFDMLLEAAAAVACKRNINGADEREKENFHDATAGIETVTFQELQVFQSQWINRVNKTTQSDMMMRQQFDCVISAPTIIATTTSKTTTTTTSSTITTTSTISTTTTGQCDSEAAVNNKKDKCTIANEGMYEVNSIISMHGNPKKKNSLRFKVRWEGYSERHDTMEPFRNVQNNKMVHDFLLHQNKKYLIPKMFRDIEN
jgi:hypothetical protein